jgi:hypothetical protein
MTAATSPLSEMHELQSDVVLQATYKAFHHGIKRALVEFLHGGLVLVDVLYGRDEPPNPAWDMLNCFISR